MSKTADSSEIQAGKWREYLALLARWRIAPHLRSKVDESDVVQQTLLEAHQAHADFRGDSDGQYAAWLRQILARNLANLHRDYARLKRNAARERLISDELDQAGSRAEWLAEQHSSVGSDVDRLTQALRLADALSNLPADQRTAIELRHLNGLPLAQIAAHLNRSSAAVAGLLHRGLEKLRLQMAHEPKCHHGNFG
jgi:RNA polymerase sigma-70 factor (ECF subfamily)